MINSSHILTFLVTLHIKETCPLHNFLVYGAELCPKFLESWSVLGVVLPAVVHDPCNLHRAGVRCRHTVSCNAPQAIKTGSPTLLAQKAAFVCSWCSFPPWYLQFSHMVFTFLHLIPCLLVGHARVRCQTQGKSLPQQNTEAPHVTLCGVAT